MHHRTCLGIKIRAGTIYNFNLHVISGEHDVLLPVGQYTLKYTAKCEEFDETESASEETII